jgi:hypothetical protein
LFENELQAMCLGGEKEQRLVAVSCRLGKIVKVLAVDKAEVLFKLKRGIKQVKVSPL